MTDELVFEVTQEANGGFCAECLTDSIVTEGNSWEELRKNVREVVRAFYFDQPEKIPALIRLRARLCATGKLKTRIGVTVSRVPGTRWGQFP